MIADYPAPLCFRRIRKLEKAVAAKADRTELPPPHFPLGKKAHPVWKSKRLPAVPSSLLCVVADADSFRAVACVLSAAALQATSATQPFGLSCRAHVAYH